MKPNFFQIFKYKVILNEAVEDEPEKAEDSPEEKEVDKVLNKSKKVRKTLVKLLTSQESDNSKARKELGELISDIRCISYKPTTFRIILLNGNYLDLKYDPTPMQIKNPSEFTESDMFVVKILGKKFHLSNNSELQQCLDYIQQIQREKALAVPEPGENETGSPTSPDSAEEPTPEEEPKVDKENP